MHPTSAPSAEASKEGTARSPAFLDSRRIAPLRIGFVVYDGLEARTGGTIYDRMMIERLALAGDLVTVFALEREASPVRAARELVDRIAKAALDVLVIDELCHRPAAHLLRLLKKGASRVRTVLLVHHLTGWERMSERAPVLRFLREVSCVRSSDAIVTTGTWAQTRLVPMRKSGGECFTVEPGADRLEATPASGPEDGRSLAPIELLFVGGLSRRKRIVELARLVSETAGVRLTIVGQPREADVAALVSEIASASPSAEPRIVFVGEVDDEDLTRRIRASDALVLPSELEGYGMVVTEALYLGTPALVSNESGLPFAVVDGVNARTFAFPELAGILAELVRDRTALLRLRAGALRSRASLPTWAHQAELFRAVLRG